MFEAPGKNVPEGLRGAKALDAGLGRATKQRAIPTEQPTPLVGAKRRANGVVLAGSRLCPRDLQGFLTVFGTL